MVASAAISRAIAAERGFVVNTTKYEIALERAKVAGWGSVTCGVMWGLFSICGDDRRRVGGRGCYHLPRR